MSTDYYAKGQRDGAKKKYEPPHGILDELMTWGKNATEKMIQENRDYKAGYANAKKQLKKK